MRLFAKIGILLLLFTQTQANASEPTNAVLFNVGVMPFGIYEAKFDKKFDKTFSLSAMATYYDSRKVLLARLMSYGYGAFAGVSPKFHLYGEALNHSFYLAPHLNAGYMYHPPSDKVPPEESKSILVRIGASFGFAHVFSNGLALDLAAGLERYHQFYFAKRPSPLQGEKETGGLFRPTVSVSIGYAF